MPSNFFLLKAHCLAGNHLLLFLATQGQRLPGAAGVQTPNPQIPSLMQRQYTRVSNPRSCKGSLFNWQVGLAKVFLFFRL